MIGRLEGCLAEKSTETVILDVGGAGYELRVPLSTFFELPDEGKTVRLRVHTYVREDQLVLYGFLTEPERAAFRLLLGASGVGPRLALAILSGLPVPQLARAVQNADVAALVAIPGVGRKTAERILVELGDRMERLAGVAPVDRSLGIEREAASALENLGYSGTQAERAVRRACASLEEGGRRDESTDLERLIREALRVVAS